MHPRVDRFGFDSVEAAVAEYEQSFGPIVMAKAALEPEGKWEALRDDLLGVFDAGSSEREGRRHPLHERLPDDDGPQVSGERPGVAAIGAYPGRSVC